MIFAMSSKQSAMQQPSRSRRTFLKDAAPVAAAGAGAEDGAARSVAWILSQRTDGLGPVAAPNPPVGGFSRDRHFPAKPCRD
jgi:hypothetical protein